MNIQQQLDDLHDYFEGRADASCEPGDDRFHGNKEMSLLRDVETIEAEVKRLRKESETLALSLSNTQQGAELQTKALAEAFRIADEERARADRIAYSANRCIELWQDGYLNHAADAKEAIQALAVAIGGAVQPSGMEMYKQWRKSKAEAPK